MKKQYWLFSVLAMFILVGCSSKTVDVYTLKYSESLSKKATFANKNKTIKISIPKSTKEIRKNKILYAKTPYMRESYAYSRWSDTPNHMIEQYLVTLLDQSKLFKAVIPADSKAKSQWILESNIEDFYQYFDKDKRAFAVVKIRFLLIDNKDKRVIASHHFSTKTPAPSLDAKGGVKAMDEALKHIGIQLVNWIDKQH